MSNAPPFNSGPIGGATPDTPTGAQLRSGSVRTSGGLYTNNTSDSSTHNNNNNNSTNNNTNNNTQTNNSSICAARSDPLWGIYIHDDVFKINQSGSELFYTLIKNNTLERLYREYAAFVDARSGAGAATAPGSHPTAATTDIDGTIVHAQLCSYLYNYPTHVPDTAGASPASTATGSARSFPPESSPHTPVFTDTDVHNELLFTFDYSFHTVNQEFKRPHNHSFASTLMSNSIAFGATGAPVDKCSNFDLEAAGIPDDLYSLMTVPHANVFEKVNTSVARSPVGGSNSHTTPGSQKPAGLYRDALNFHTCNFAFMSQLTSAQNRQQGRHGQPDSSSADTAAAAASAAAPGSGTRSVAARTAAVPPDHRYMVDIEGAIEERLGAPDPDKGESARRAHISGDAAADNERKIAYYRKAAAVIERLLLDKRKINHYYTKNASGNQSASNANSSRSVSDAVHPLHYYSNSHLFNNIREGGGYSSQQNNTTSNSTTSGAGGGGGGTTDEDLAYVGNTVYDFRIAEQQFALQGSSDVNGGGGGGGEDVFQNHTSFIKALGVCLKTMKPGDESFFVVRQMQTHKYTLAYTPLLMQNASRTTGGGARGRSLSLDDDDDADYIGGGTAGSAASRGNRPLNCTASDGNVGPQRMYFGQQAIPGVGGGNHAKEMAQRLNDANKVQVRSILTASRLTGECSSGPIILRIRLRATRRYFPLFMNPNLPALTAASPTSGAVATATASANAAATTLPLHPIVGDVAPLQDRSASSTTPGGGGGAAEPSSHAAHRHAASSDVVPLIAVTMSIVNVSSTNNRASTYARLPPDENPFWFLRHTQVFERDPARFFNYFLHSDHTSTADALPGEYKPRLVAAMLGGSGGDVRDSQRPRQTMKFLQKYLLSFFITQMRMLGVEYCDIFSYTDGDDLSGAERKASARAFIESVLLAKTGLLARCGYYLFQKKPSLLGYKSRHTHHSGGSAAGGAGGARGSEDATLSSGHYTREDLRENYETCYKNKTIRSQAVGGVTQAPWVDLVLSAIPYHFGRQCSADLLEGGAEHQKVTSLLHLNDLDVNYLFCSNASCNPTAMHSSGADPTTACSALGTSVTSANFVGGVAAEVMAAAVPNFSCFNHNTVEEEKFMTRFLTQAQAEAAAVVQTIPAPDDGGAPPLSLPPTRAAGGDAKAGRPGLSRASKLGKLLHALHGGDVAGGATLFTFYASRGALGQSRDSGAVAGDGSDPQQAHLHRPHGRKSSAENSSAADRLLADLHERMGNEALMSRAQSRLPFAGHRLLGNSAFYLKIQYQNHAKGAGGAKRSSSGNRKSGGGGSGGFGAAAGGKGGAAFVFSDLEPEVFYSVSPTRSLEYVEGLLTEVSGMLFYFAKMQHYPGSSPHSSGHGGGAEGPKGIPLNYGDLNAFFNSRVNRAAEMHGAGRESYNVLTEALLGSRQLAQAFFELFGNNSCYTTSLLHTSRAQPGALAGCSYCAPTPFALAQGSFFCSFNTLASTHDPVRAAHLHKALHLHNYYFVFSRLLWKCHSKLLLALLALFLGTSDAEPLSSPQPPVVGAANDPGRARNCYIAQIFQYFLFIFDAWQCLHNLQRRQGQRHPRNQSDVPSSQQQRAGSEEPNTANTNGNTAAASATSPGAAAGAAANVFSCRPHPFTESQTQYMYALSSLALLYYPEPAAPAPGPGDAEHKHDLNRSSLSFMHTQVLLETVAARYARGREWLAQVPESEAGASAASEKPERPEDGWTAEQRHSFAELETLSRELLRVAQIAKETATRANSQQQQQRQANVAGGSAPSAAEGNVMDASNSREAEVTQFRAMVLDVLITALSKP